MLGISFYKIKSFHSFYCIVMNSFPLIQMPSLDWGMRVQTWLGGHHVFSGLPFLQIRREMFQNLQVQKRGLLRPCERQLHLCPRLPRHPVWRTVSLWQVRTKLQIGLSVQEWQWLQPRNWEMHLPTWVGGAPVRGYLQRRHVGPQLHQPLRLSARRRLQPGDWGVHLWARPFWGAVQGNLWPGHARHELSVPLCLRGAFCRRVWSWNWPVSLQTWLQRWVKWSKICESIFKEKIQKLIQNLGFIT